MPAIPRLDAQSTGSFPRPGTTGPQNTGSFPRPGTGAPQDTGSFPRPGANGSQNTGSFPRPGANGSQDTGSFPRPDFDAPRPGANSPQNGGQFVRSDVFGAPNSPANNPSNPANTGQFAVPQAYDGSSTGQFATPGFDNGSTGQHNLPGRQNPQNTGQFERPQVNGNRNGADFGTPRPPAPQRPTRQEPEALPPASGPGDGRTPLYDTLETNWFHGQQAEAQSQSNGSAPAATQPQAPQAPATPPQRPTGGTWRSSPNDDLVRQAERVRQPAAGGVTTSGLPRRVPRANLVPGTAQQQQHQTGPQVSRAPDDVRGRLTNLRRGIAQGRQAGTGTGQTGSFPSPTHQQER
jgi:hypothetical protein